MKNSDKRDQFRKRLYNFVACLIKFLNALPKDLLTREIKHQLIRSGASIGANYFESEAASSRRDFQNYFNHSLKSANETKFWLRILQESNLVPEELSCESNWLYQETEELANIFASSILTMKGKK